LKFLDHTKSDTHIQSVGLFCTSDQSVPKPTTYRTRNKDNRRIAVTSVGFERATSAIKRLYNYKLHRTFTGDQRLYWKQQCPLKRKHTIITHKISVQLSVLKHSLYCYRYGCRAQQIFTDIQWLTIRTKRFCNCLGNVLQNGRMFNKSERKSVSLLLYRQTVCCIHTAQNVITVTQEDTEIWRRDRHNLV